MVVSLDGQFSGSTAVLVKEINKEERLADSKFEKSFTNVEGRCFTIFTPPAVGEAEF